jgi:hypothetical protein
MRILASILTSFPALLQNNDRGGYNVGQGEARNRGLKEGGGTLSYVEGSKLSIQWTNQHECGGQNTHCDVILQYMNDKGIRDGTAQGQPLELGLCFTLTNIVATSVVVLKKSREAG